MYHTLANEELKTHGTPGSILADFGDYEPDNPLETTKRIQAGVNIVRSAVKASAKVRRMEECKEICQNLLAFWAQGLSHETRKEMLLQCTGLGTMAFETLCIPEFISESHNNIEMDCRGTVTVGPIDKIVTIALGEIKKSASHMQKAIRQIFRRFAVFSHAASIIHPNHEVRGELAVWVGCSATNQNHTQLRQHWDHCFENLWKEFKGDAYCIAAGVDPSIKKAESRKFVTDTRVKTRMSLQGL